MQNINILLFVVLNELKERLIVVWSNFQEDINDTVFDQCRKHLQACVGANGGHLNTFCEKKLLQTICIFHVFLF